MLEYLRLIHDSCLQDLSLDDLAGIRKGGKRGLGSRDLHFSLRVRLNILKMDIDGGNMDKRMLKIVLTLGTQHNGW